MNTNSRHRISRLSIPLTAGLALALWLALAAPALARSTKDRNHDGIPDRWEKKFHLPLNVNEAKRDQDHDGLNNLQEFRHGTNPRVADTDHDGLNDGNEVKVGDNPTNPDSNGDGVKDGNDNAGTVSSFDPATGVLTIALFNGSSVTGTVDSSTRIECDHEGSANGEGDHNDGDHEGDNQGADDQGDQGDGNDQGDDSAQGGCTTADLTPGTLVHEASINLTSSGPVYEKVELAK